MSTYAIKDLEKLSGIKAHTIRAWEQRYELWVPERSETNIRLYNDQHLKQLLNISLLLKNGHKISKICTFCDQEMHERIEKLFHEDFEADESLEPHINGLVVAMIEMNEPMFDKIFNTCVLRMGFERTVLQLIYPFLHKVGMMWGISQVNPAQEHFVSNLARQKLIVAIDGQSAPTNPTDTYLLFLPEGELHEMGLLLACFLLKSRGQKVIYLGQNVPLCDLARVVEIGKPTKLLSFIITPILGCEAQQYVDQLSASFPEQEVLFSGNLGCLNSVDCPANVSVIQSVDDLLVRIEHA